VPYSQVARGYEVDGEWVVLSDAELEAAEPKRSREIDLRLFVERDELDPVFFERAYYLVPAEESTKAYRLLAQTMEQTGRAGTATFVMRTQEYVVAILAENGVLRAETMRFADEIRSPDDVDLPEPREPKAADVKRMRSQISKLEKKDIARSELEDRNAERLLRVIERKRKKGVDVVESDVVAERDEEDGDVIDLMDVIKQRLAASETLRSGRSGNGRRSSGSGKAKSRGPSKRAIRDGGNLAGLSKKELYERAQAEDIEGRSGMTKDELVRALSA
jgi:DNA end-binding protein Ku